MTFESMNRFESRRRASSLTNAPSKRCLVMAMAWSPKGSSYTLDRMCTVHSIHRTPTTAFFFFFFCVVFGFSSFSSFLSSDPSSSSSSSRTLKRKAVARVASCAKLSRRAASKCRGRRVSAWRNSSNEPAAARAPFWFDE